MNKNVKINNIKFLTINSMNTDYIKTLMNDKHDKIIIRITKNNFKQLLNSARYFSFTNLILSIIYIQYDEYVYTLYEKIFYCKTKISFYEKYLYRFVNV